MFLNIVFRSTVKQSMIGSKAILSVMAFLVKLQCRMCVFGTRIQRIVEQHVIMEFTKQKAIYDYMFTHRIGAII